MAYTKPFPKANAVKRAFHMALTAPVAVRSIDFIDSDGKKTSFNLGDPAAPTTTETTKELDQWMEKHAD